MTRKAEAVGLLPADGRPAACRDCGARVLWAVTDSGRRTPVDPQLAIDGSLVLFFEVDGVGHPLEPEVQRVRRAGPGYIGPRWLSHFITCPKATILRRRDAEGGRL